MPGMVGAAVPVQDSDKLVVLVDRKVCLVDRETGLWHARGSVSNFIVSNIHSHRQYA